MFVFGEAARFVFAPNLLTVDMHVEHAARPLDELGRHVELLLDGFRQTGGAREVVSLRAVLDGDVH